MHLAPRDGSPVIAGLVAALTAVVVLALFLYTPLASDAALRDSDRARAASFTVATPADPGSDQRGPAAGVPPALDAGLALREWTASAPVDVVASGGTAVNLPAGLRITAVGSHVGDRGAEVDDDGFVRVSVTEVDAQRFDLAEGDTLSVAGADGTQRLRIVDAALPTDQSSPDSGDDSLSIAVSPADLPRFSEPATLGWTYTLTDSPSAGAARATAEELRSLPSRLAEIGAAPEGTTTSGELPAVLAEAAAAHRVALNLALNGALLVSLVGVGVVVQLRSRRRYPVGSSPRGAQLRWAAPLAAGAVILAVALPLLVGVRDGVPPLSVAPAVLVAVGALSAAALLPVLGVRRGRTRTVSPRTLLTSRSLARRASHRYTAVLLTVLAVGSGVTGAVVVGSIEDDATSSAVLATGGDVRVVVPTGTGAAGLEAVTAALPDGVRAARVLRVPAEVGGLPSELLAVDTSALVGVLPGGSRVDAGRLADALRPSIASPEPARDLQPTARQVRFQLTTRPVDGDPAPAGPGTAPSSTARISAWLEREDGTLAQVPAGTLVIAPGEVQQHSLSFTVPDDLRSEAIAAVDVAISPADAAPSGSPTAAPSTFVLELVSTSTDTTIGTGESRFAPESDFAVVPSLPGIEEAGVIDLDDGVGFTASQVSEPLTVRMAAGPTLDSLAVATTSSSTVEDAREVVVAGAPLPAVAAVERALPGVADGAAALLTDLRTASYVLLLTADGPPEPDELWLSASDPTALAASVGAAAPPGSVVTTAVVDPVGAPLAPLAWLIAAACFLGALGVVLSSTARHLVSARDGAVLEMLGVPGAAVSGARRRVLVTVLGVGVLLGLAVGALAVVLGEGPATGLADGGLLGRAASFDPALALATAAGVVLLVVAPLVLGSSRERRQGADGG